MIFVSNASAQSSPDALAKQIYQATGVQGGLVVHLGSGDGELTAALHATDSFLVHGWDADPAKVNAGRAYVQSLGLYGDKVSIDRLKGDRLPYIDNPVNLLVAEDLGPISKLEAMRVLVPNGVLYTKENGVWTKTIKPKPIEIDEWTHYMHGPTNNAVGKDLLVGPPRHLQWVGSPNWSRHHDHMSSTNALVTANGRIFYIFDEGPRSHIELPSQWYLIARDAFNGTILWKRSIDKWHTQLWPLKSGPAPLPRRLVAIGDRVYVTLAIDAPLAVLDAATGKTLAMHEQTGAAEEVIVDKGQIFVVGNDEPEKSALRDVRHGTTAEHKADGRERAWDDLERRVMMIDDETGETVWEDKNTLMPLTMTVDDERVYYHNGDRVVCLDRETGKRLWESKSMERRNYIRPFFAPTLVVQDGVVLFSGGSEKDSNVAGENDIMRALIAETGEEIWSADHPSSGYKSPEDILVIDGQVWTTENTRGTQSGVFTGRDIHTGEIKTQFPPNVDTYWFHHRCYRSKATEKYIMSSRTGIEFIDPKTGNWDINHWVRGACFYGVMPANGLTYTPPHPCACYIEAKLYGFNALAPASEGRKINPTPEAERLEKGPAYGQAVPVDAPGPADWPTFRSDTARSGFNTTPVSTRLAHAWEIDMGGKVSQPVVASGRLYVAAVDRHAVHALNADTGRPLWRFTAGGRVDSPPTIHEGRVMFGSRDGYVYCLRATDGALIWRYQAAPEDRRLVSYEQVESVWPVHGSVLIKNGALYTVAGRTMFMDGGLRFLKLDPVTGRKLSETLLDEKDPNNGENLQQHIEILNMTTALPDILTSDGESIYMRSMPFTFEGKRKRIKHIPAEQQQGEYAHLFCPTGFLDDAWWHRSYWVWGRSFASGHNGYHVAGRYAPAGRLLVHNDDTVYGYGRQPEFYKWTTELEYYMFASPKVPDIVPLVPRYGAESPDQPNAAPTPQQLARQQANRQQANNQQGARRNNNRRRQTMFTNDWAKDGVPFQVRGLVLTGDTIFAAGPPDVLDTVDAGKRLNDPDVLADIAKQQQALDGELGALLWAVSAKDGKRLAEYKLDRMPAFDGMAAANNRLYISTADGRLVCLKGSGGAE
jgi:outer membrane protein assembly factor BamB